MREQRDDRQEVVGSEEELKRRDVKACGREVEVRVEVQRCAPEQDCADVNDQEEREIGAGDRLQPRNEAMPLLPPSDDKRETADDLKRNAAQESELDQWKAVDRPGNLHERNVFGRSRQTDQVIGDVQAHEGCNENRRECMESAKCHVRPLTIYYLVNYRINTFIG